MMLSKIQKWLDSEFFPQRVLFSGGDLDSLIEIASELQETDKTKIITGICADTLVLQNDGALKIGDKDQPEKKSVRGMIKWITQTPVKKYRIIILEDFERVGREANHALLKVLEEPPPQAIFLFSTKNHHQILDTILSRMTVIRASYDFEDFMIDEDIKNFLQSSNLIWKFKKISDLDKEAKKNKDKKNIIDFIDKLIIHARFFAQYQKYLDLIFEVQSALNKNQNTKLVLERFALKITKN